MPPRRRMRCELFSRRSSRVKPASPTGDVRDGLAAILGRGLATKIACPKRGFGKRGVDGIGDATGCVAEAKMFEHHRRRPDLTDRIGDALSGDVRRRAVDRFEQRREIAGRVDVSRRCDADGSGAGRTEVGQDVTEKIRGDDNVEPVRMLDEMGRQDIDVEFVDSQVGIAPVPWLRRVRPNRAW